MPLSPDSPSGDRVVSVCSVDLGASLRRDQRDKKFSLSSDTLSAHRDLVRDETTAVAGVFLVLVGS